MVYIIYSISYIRGRPVERAPRASRASTQRATLRATRARPGANISEL